MNQGRSLTNDRYIIALFRSVGNCNKISSIIKFLIYACRLHEAVYMYVSTYGTTANQYDIIGSIFKRKYNSKTLKPKASMAVIILCRGQFPSGIEVFIYTFAEYENSPPVCTMRRSDRGQIIHVILTDTKSDLL